MSIQIINLSRSYGDFQAVRQLNLSIPPGEIFSLLGPNGAGKTTTLKLLSGLLFPDSGQIFLGKYDLSLQPLRAREILGYIPDFPFVYDNLTTEEFLQFTGKIYRLPSDRLIQNQERLLSLFGLEKLRHKLTRHLSHGYRQRLVFAATLLHEPEILLIDEPMVGLDPATGRLLKDILLEFADHDGTILISTHTLSFAEEISNRIGIMHQGNLIECGTPAQIKGGGSLEEAFLAETGEKGDV